MIPSRTERLEGATSQRLLQEAQQPRDHVPARTHKAIRRVKQACVLNAVRMKEWGRTGNPIMHKLRGVMDSKTKKLRSPEDLERRWLTRANEIGSCSRSWSRVRCARCGALEARLLVCNQRYCPHCIGPRRRGTEQRVRNMLKALPRDSAIFPVVLTTRSTGSVIGSSQRLQKKFKRFLKDEYIQPRVVGGGRKYEATHKSSQGPHPHLHAVLCVRKREGYRPRLEWAEMVSAWAHADAGDGLHCRCSRRGPRGKPVLCCHSSYDNSKKDLFDVCGDPECTCRGCDVEPQSQHVDWNCSKKDHARVAGEIGKYLAKELADPGRYGLTDEDLADLLLEMQGLRAWQTFGIAYRTDKLDVTEPSARPACPKSELGEPCDWQPHDRIPGDRQSPRPPPDFFGPIPLAA